MKSRYSRAKRIKTINNKEIFSMHSMAKTIDLDQLSLIPVEVKMNTRLDVLAEKYLGNGRLWWVIAYVNNIYWPWNIQKGATIFVPQSVDDVLEYF